MKISKFLSHFGFFILTAAFLTLPVLSAHLFLSFSGDGPVERGTVLSAESSSFSRYLRYLNTQPLTGFRPTVSVYVFPGQTTSYRNVYQVKNRESRPLQVHLTNLQVNAAPVEVQANVYFGENPAAAHSLLPPGQGLTVTLRLTASTALPQPRPVEVSFSLETE